jgi:hypothetical protein
VEHYEYGNNKPRPKRVHALAKFLDVSVIDISDLPPEAELVKSYIDTPCLKLCENWGDADVLMAERYNALSAIEKERVNEYVKHLSEDAKKKSVAQPFDNSKAGNDR